MSKSAKSGNSGNIPKAIQDRVQKMVTEYNQQNFRRPEHGYIARFKNRFLFLDRADRGVRLEICRLTYNGSMKNWDFAIYLHSRNRYDPDEWLFPGSEEFDGTLESALKVGMIAYPVDKAHELGGIFKAIARLFSRH